MKPLKVVKFKNPIKKSSFLYPDKISKLNHHETFRTLKMDSN